MTLLEEQVAQLLRMAEAHSARCDADMAAAEKCVGSGQPQRTLELLMSAQLAEGQARALAEASLVIQKVAQRRKANG